MNQTIGEQRADLIVNAEQANVTLVTNPFMSQILNTYRPHIQRFIEGFPLTVREILTETMNTTFTYMESFNEERFNHFLGQYNLGEVESHRKHEGLEPLLKLLVLLRAYYPDLTLISGSNLANIRLDNNSWRMLLYSMHRESMPSIVLGYVKRLFEGPGINRDLFPLIMDNYHNNPTKNLCVHCSGKTFSFSQILRNFGRGEYLGSFHGVESNSYSEMDKIIVHCSTCIHNKCEEAIDPEDLIKVIREVV
ncbi:ABC-three component system protein [Desulfosporosinus orientis]|uniref:ABC-three component system protein n=1 Tax=Desulfosporosinus orientis TaxID=1563 RepID=UPI0002E6E69D|nr:ABC-three component system protein [Desulfosporosinus orientis]